MYIICRWFFGKLYFKHKRVVHADGHMFLSKSRTDVLLEKYPTSSMKTKLPPYLTVRPFSPTKIFLKAHLGIYYILATSRV